MQNPTLPSLPLHLFSAKALDCIITKFILVSRGTEHKAQNLISNHGGIEALHHEIVSAAPSNHRLQLGSALSDDSELLILVINNGEEQVVFDFDPKTDDDTKGLPVHMRNQFHAELQYYIDFLTAKD